MMQVHDIVSCYRAKHEGAALHAALPWCDDMHLYMSSTGLSDAKLSAPAADCNAPQGPAAVQQPPPNTGAHEQDQQPTHTPLLPATPLGSSIRPKSSPPTPPYPGPPTQPGLPLPDRSAGAQPRVPG